MFEQNKKQKNIQNEDIHKIIKKKVKEAFEEKGIDVLKIILFSIYAQGFKSAGLEKILNQIYLSQPKNFQQKILFFIV